MSDEIKYAVMDKTESFAESFFKDVVTFSFLCFSIWLSQGSKWWTFVTGLMFMLFIFSKLSLGLKRYKRFKTKAELQTWVDSLD